LGHCENPQLTAATTISMKSFYC